MQKLYFSGPLFSRAEKEFNKNLSAELEKRGFSVFLPQRDGAENDPAINANLTKDERKEAIFAVDRMRILECDVFLMILDGRVPDEGACVELGIAYAQKYLKQSKKILIGLHTDSRGAFIGSKVNPMINQALDAIVRSEDELFSYLDSQRMAVTSRG